jgi:hypothetical protein
VRDVAGAGSQPLRLRLRIDQVCPHPDKAAVTLHDFRVEQARRDWRPYCTPDAWGGAAGVPLAGARTEWGAVCPQHPRRPEPRGTDEVRAASPALAEVPACPEEVARALRRGSSTARVPCRKSVPDPLSFARSCA